MFRKPFRHVNSLSSTRLTLAMVGLFVLVQGGYRLAGVSFDATPLIHFWQFLDPELLRSRLGESLLYLHSQPPLFNLFLGLVLKLAPGAEAATFGALYLALGLALYLLTFAVMRQLGVGRPVALALSTWLMVSPSFVLYEHWLFYTLPLATLLMTSAWLLGKLLAFGIWIRGFSRLGGPREKPAEASNPTNQQSIFRTDDHAASDATADENVRSNDFSRSARATATKVATTNPPIFRTVPFGLATAFFLTLFLLAGIRSLFQLPYYLLLVAGLLVACRRCRRQIAWAALIPGLLVIALYGKNLALFGRFTTSTWLGMNYWGVISRNISGPELDALAAQGQLSPLARIDRFAPLADYPAEYRRATGYEEIMALHQVAKSTGAVNYNHLAYLAISDAYLRDALYVTIHAPRFFLTGVIKGWFHYFQSSSDYVFVEVNRARIAGISDLYDTLFYGKLPFDLAQVAALPLNHGGARYVYLFLLTGLPLVVFYALRVASRWKEVGALSASQRVLILYLCFNIVYVAFVGNLLEVGENNRFRFMTDPFSLALAGLFIETAVMPRVRKRVIVS